MASKPASQSCSTEGHQGEEAMGVVVLADCTPEGSCTGHPYCAECIGALTDNDPYNTLLEDWRPPDPPEVPDLFYIDGLTESEALRELADRLEKDTGLVLIGLWNIGYEESTVAHLQVVATHMGGE